MEFAYKIGLIVNVIAVIVCPIVAHSKGRSAFGWFFGGLLLSGIGLIIICCLKDISVSSSNNYSYQHNYSYARKPQQTPIKWKCPQCGTMNNEVDTYCIKCLSEKDSGSNKTQSKTDDMDIYDY